jgi:hypothetical protein
MFYPDTALFFDGRAVAVLAAQSDRRNGGINWQIRHQLSQKTFWTMPTENGLRR